MDLYCENAEAVLCEPLVRVEIKIERHLPRVVSFKCGFDAQACAKLNIATGECTIYLSNERDLTHEMNHCFGWTHQSNKSKAYKETWKPFPQFN